MSETGESHGGDGPRSSVFQYRDYARFLSDFVAERKRCSPSFSYKVLCRAAGLRSQSLVGMIATGQRLPSRDVLRKLNGAMRLTPAERDYLETLVEYQKSRDDAAQRTLARKLDALGHKYEARPISLDHFRLISDWYHLVILELLNLKDFVEDPAWIAARLGGRITVAQAEEAWARLLRLRIIVRDERGALRFEPNSYVADAKVTDEAVNKFHRQMAALAVESAQRQPRADLKLSSTTVAIDSARLTEATEAIIEFRTRFMSEFASQSGDEVFQLNLHLFRLSEGEGSKGASAPSQPSR